MKLTNTGRYWLKDQIKSDKATKFIGVGAPGSSTEVYRRNWFPYDNHLEYTSNDKVFVSINGRRPNRVSIREIEIYLRAAVQAGVMFITDTSRDRARSYNIGEREMANFLKKSDYVEIAPGEWRPK